MIIVVAEGSRGDLPEMPDTLEASEPTAHQDHLPG